MGLFVKISKIAKPERKREREEFQKDMSRASQIESDNTDSQTVSNLSKQLPLTDDEKRELVSSLTVRERDIYLLLVEGFTLKEVAKQSGIKYSTANTHMTGVYKKLNVNTRAELIINYRDMK